MSPRSAERAGTAQVAIVGAATGAGWSLRKALAEFGLPGSRVDLYGAATGEAVLSDYDGEARLVQELDLGDVARRQVVFLCERCSEPARFFAMASAGTVVLDLVRGLPPGRDRRLVHVGITPEVPRADGGVFAVPHELTGLLVELLHPIERRFGVEEAVAVIVRPASDFGDAGIEELREQTIRLLRFDELPRDVFGGQLAFNVIPQQDCSVARDVGGEVAELMGWQAGNRLALRTLIVPVFYGHGVQLHLRCRNETSVEALGEALGAASGRSVAEGSCTPMDVSSEGRTLIGAPQEDGLGGYWLWAVVGEVHARRARLAVRLAAGLCDL